MEDQTNTLGNAETLDDEHRVVPFEGVGLPAGLSFAEENPSGYGASTFVVESEIGHGDAVEPSMTSPASEPLDAEDMMRTADTPVENLLDSSEVFFYDAEFPEVYQDGEAPALYAEENSKHVPTKNEAPPPVASAIDSSMLKLQGENSRSAGAQSGSRMPEVHDGSRRRATPPQFPRAGAKLSAGIAPYPTEAVAADKPASPAKRARPKAPNSPASPGGVQDSNAGTEAREKKKRLMWTSKLHNRFLEAIKAIGINNAGPKNVLLHMGIPGITTEHVKSHLQKYRNNLKKDAAQESRAAVISPVNVATRQAVNVHVMNNMPAQNPQYQYPVAMVNQNVSDALQQHADWQAEVHDKTLRCLLQMQMSHNLLGSIQRKFHLGLERMKRHQGQHSQQHADELFRENERLMNEHAQMQKELTMQHAGLRDLVDEAERLRQSYVAYGLLRTPMQQPP
mmetsp:Transcript_43608/g.170651  ORF Transcript_43608/g.170651 Transcript_43608/m.170651 type:complete len:452 (-) Transcript_43608:1638-2993(-)|eukprot:CAMPEP_0113959880 /NCGR_PEP_ID=MMETSP0011_2-20120614/4396_1 /TAXON_ID=101924 /ORGANISM="Rhodosorus marinus" /LENGTH=451 /DNA_ID=CAMNT_0000971253 /DNA_START=269 /DNA_END=1624 /DNA_ORIENTATION=+ /assembly_acc=CAM_ASM_000156